MHRIIHKGVTYNFELAALAERHHGSAAAPFSAAAAMVGRDDAESECLMSVLVLEEGQAGGRAEKKRWRSMLVQYYLYDC